MAYVISALVVIAIIVVGLYALAKRNKKDGVSAYYIEEARKARKQ